MLCAWARRNSDQVGPIRRGAGPRPELRNTVVPAMTAEDIAAALSEAPVALADACAPAAAGGVPTAPGFYAWWAEPACIEELPHLPHPAEPALGLFYIGISPRDEKSAQTLRGRVVGQPLGGNTSSSTFRFVLAALLTGEINLRDCRRAVASASTGFSSSGANSSTLSVP
jgi:hypothetical protein